MTARERFCAAALAQLGKQVLWGTDGPATFDCSGLVAYALKQAGGPDWRATHTAQRLADETPDLATFEDVTAPLPGDLCFFGADNAHVTHVGIWMTGGECLSADGATSRVTDLAKVSPRSIVRLHENTAFRRDFLGVHRFTQLDAIDSVCR